MKKILITGAGGFVGSRILQQWQGKYELCALPKGFFCTADEALTRAQVEALHPDVILHTAALSDNFLLQGNAKVPSSMTACRAQKF